MKNLFRFVKPTRFLFSSKKLGIADTAKVIQDKILNISQIVKNYLLRMMLNNLEQSLVLETVSQESSVLIKSKQDRWSSLDPELEVWHSTYKLIM